MSWVAAVQVVAAFRTFDDAANTYDSLTAIASGLKKGNDAGWAANADPSKYLWNPVTPLVKTALEEQKRIQGLAAVFQRISQFGVDPAVTGDVGKLTEFNKKTLALSHKANYYAQGLGAAEREIRRLLANDRGLLMMGAFFGTTALHATVFQMGEAVKSLKGQLGSLETQANAAIARVNRDATPPGGKKP